MKTILIFPILIISLALDSKSQVDTLSPAPRCDTTHIECNRVYQLFIANRNREVNNLWKLNLAGGYFLKNLSFSYEHKICKSITTESSLIGNFIELSNWEHLYFGVSQDVRYYYNQGRRERLGKRVNGFSGNYFSFGVFFNNSIIYTHNRVESIPPFYYPPCSFGLNVLHGMQRRIGNIGYIDLFLGLQAYKPYHAEFYDNSNIKFKPSLGIRAGFAIDSFKNLKKMLK